MKPHLTISCRATLKPFALKIAALLLVLHWASPNLWPFEAISGLGKSAPTYSTGSFDVHQGALPRALARVQTLDAGVAKVKRDAWPSTGKLATLAAAGRVHSLPPLAEERLNRSAKSVASLTHSFEARGPPAL